MPLDKTSKEDIAETTASSVGGKKAEGSGHAGAQESALDMIVDFMDPLDAIAKWRYDTLKQDIAGKSHLKGVSKEEQARLNKELADGTRECAELIHIHNDTNRLIKEGIKSAGLFMRGTPAAGLTLLTYGLDEWKPKANPQAQTVDVILGAAKGAALKAAFGKLGALETDVHLVPGLYSSAYKFLGVRVFGMGTASRLIDTSLSRSSWENEKTHKIDIAQGADRLKQAVFSPMIASDLVGAGAASLLHLGANKALGDSLLRKPLASYMVMGAGYGLTNGATGEYMEEKEQIDHKERKSFDFGRISGMGLGASFVGALSAAPGGLQARGYVRAESSQMNYAKGTSITKANRNLFPNPGEGGNREGPQATSSVRENQSSDSQLPYAYAQRPPETVEARFARLKPEGKDRQFLPGQELEDPLLMLFSPRESTVPFTRYAARGHNTRIFVEDSYLSHLNKLREARKSCEHSVTAPEFNTHALPEDFAYLLDELPNSSMIKNIVVWGRYLDPEFGTNPEATRTLASINKNYKMSAYRMDNDEELYSTLVHEATHGMQFKFPEIEKLNEYAVYRESGLSKRENNPLSYGMKNAVENQAVLAESLLHRDAKEFFKWVEKAPARTSVLAYGLKKTLDLEPNEVRLNEGAHRKRIEFIARTALKQIISPIENKLQDGQLVGADDRAFFKTLCPKRYNKALREGIPKEVQKSSPTAMLQNTRDYLNNEDIAFDQRLALLTELESQFSCRLKVANLLDLINNELSMSYIGRIQEQSSNPAFVRKHETLGEGIDTHFRKKPYELEYKHDCLEFMRALEWVKSSAFKGTTRMRLLNHLEDQLNKYSPSLENVQALYIDLLHAYSKAGAAGPTMVNAINRMAEAQNIKPQNFLKGLSEIAGPGDPLITSNHLACAAEAQQDAKNYEQAAKIRQHRINALKEACKTDNSLLPELAAATYDRGRSFYIDGKDHQAIEAFKEALSIASALPPSDEIESLKGEINHRLKKLKS